MNYFMPFEIHCDNTQPMKCRPHGPTEHKQAKKKCHSWKIGHKHCVSITDLMPHTLHKLTKYNHIKRIMLRMER